MNQYFNSDYRIEGLSVLLCKDCLPERYHPLIEYKKQLICNLSAMGYKTKSVCINLSDKELIKAGLPDSRTAELFRRFLCIYDYKGKGIRDIPDAREKSDDEIASLLELMRLPGVKAIRSGLYYRSGIRSLSDFASADAEQLRQRIIETIARESLPCTPSLPKELRTQIAVAKVLTEYAAE